MPGQLCVPRNSPADCWAGGGGLRHLLHVRDFSLKGCTAVSTDDDDTSVSFARCKLPFADVSGMVLEGEIILHSADFTLANVSRCVGCLVAQPAGWRCKWRMCHGSFHEVLYPLSVVRTTLGKCIPIDVMWYRAVLDGFAITGSDVVVVGYVPLFVEVSPECVGLAYMPGAWPYGFSCGCGATVMTLCPSWSLMEPVSTPCTSSKCDGPSDLVQLNNCEFESKFESAVQVRRRALVTPSACFLCVCVLC